MPRSPDLVARELAAHGCELPQENLDGLASRLFPDETVMAALLGAGAVVSDGGVETKHDELLLVVTSCRVRACA